MKIFCNNEENGITIEIKIDDIKDDENMLYWTRGLEFWVSYKDFMSFLEDLNNVQV